MTELACEQAPRWGKKREKNWRAERAERSLFPSLFPRPESLFTGYNNQLRQTPHGGLKSCHQEVSVKRRLTVLACHNSNVAKVVSK